MSIHTYNVSASDVLDRLPYDTSAVGASTEPLSTGDIDGYIEDASSEISGILEKSGLQGADLSDEAERQAQTAIKNYAIAESLAQVGHTGSAYSEAKSKYRDARERFERTPQLIDRNQSRVSSNVDTYKDSSEFSDLGYQF